MGRLVYIVILLSVIVAGTLAIISDGCTYQNRSRIGNFLNRILFLFPSCTHGD
jgi:hypothetical protein